MFSMFSLHALLALALLTEFVSAVPSTRADHHIRVAHRRRTSPRKRVCKNRSSSASSSFHSATSTYAVPTSSAVESSTVSPTKAVASTAKTSSLTSSTKAAHSSSAAHSASASSASASASSKPVPVNNLLAIFPVGVKNAVSSWSTSSLVGSPKPLSDSTLNIYAGKQTEHKFMNAPDGSHSMRAFFNAGSISPGHTPVPGGFSLYAKGLTDLTEGNEVTFAYSVWFEEGFKFNKGGKMPGLYGGTNDGIAIQCSGGHHNPDCWSLRLMWREDGEGELYAYLPQVSANTNAFAAVKPKTISNDVYGTSVARGAYTWKTGAWTHVAQRVKLNDIGKQNGEVEVYVDGKSVISVTGLQFRTKAESKVRGAQIQTFFGGHDESWASPKTQSAYFKDFSAAVIG